MSFIPKVCLYCHNLFEAKLSEHKRGKALYCNEKCYRDSINTIKVNKRCLFCAIDFLITKQDRKDAKYCSRGCYNKSLRLNKTKQCKYCKSLIPFKSGYYKRQFCSISCSVQYRIKYK